MGNSATRRLFTVGCRRIASCSSTTSTPPGHGRDRGHRPCGQPRPPACVPGRDRGPARGRPTVGGVPDRIRARLRRRRAGRRARRGAAQLRICTTTSTRTTCRTGLAARTVTTTGGARSPRSRRSSPSRPTTSTPSGSNAFSSRQCRGRPGSGRPTRKSPSCSLRCGRGPTIPLYDPAGTRHPSTHSRRTPASSYGRGDPRRRRSALMAPTATGRPLRSKPRLSSSPPDRPTSCSSRIATAPASDSTRTPHQLAELTDADEDPVELLQTTCSKTTAPTDRRDRRLPAERGNGLRLIPGDESDPTAFGSEDLLRERRVGVGRDPGIADGDSTLRPLPLGEILGLPTYFRAGDQLLESTSTSHP